MRAEGTSWQPSRPMWLAPNHGCGRSCGLRPDLPGPLVPSGGAERRLTKRVMISLAEQTEQRWARDRYAATKSQRWDVSASHGLVGC